MPAPPFVNYLNIPLSQVGSAPIELDIAKDHACIADGLIAANINGQNITVSVGFIRDGVYYEIMSNYGLTFGETEDLFANKTLYLNQGDKLRMFCDPGQYPINMFLSYRELVEL